MDDKLSLMNNSKTFCVYPWININTNTTGNCKLCCNIVIDSHIKKPTGQDFLLGTDSIGEIWNSDYMKNTRYQMLNNQQPKDCNMCYQRELDGVYSSRQWANHSLMDSDVIQRINQTHKDGQLDLLPNSLELRLGNKCNLKCNSCWSISSSNLAIERLHNLHKAPTWLRQEWQSEIDLFAKQNWEWYNTPKFDEFIDLVAPKLKRLYLTGGEPTLIEKNYEILRKLILAENKDCFVSFTTNLTTFDKDFYNMLEYFHHSEVQCSIDGIDKVNTYIRWPSNWKIITNNFAKVCLLLHKTQVKIYTVVQLMNGENLTEIIDFANQHNTQRPLDWVPIFLEHPEYLKIHNLSQSKLDIIVEDLKNQNYENTNMAHAIEKVINYILSSKSVQDHTSKQRFTEFSSTIDKIRSISLVDYVPKVKQEFGEP